MSCLRSLSKLKKKIGNRSEKILKGRKRNEKKRKEKTQ